MRRISFSDCPYCHSSEVYRSRRKTWGDLGSLFFLLGIARCRGCMRRHFRPVFFLAPEYISRPANKPIPIRIDQDRKRSA